MTWTESLSKIDRVQQSMIFKIVATVIIALAGIGGVLAYSVSQQAKANATAPLVDPNSTSPTNPSGPGPTSSDAAAPGAGTAAASGSVKGEAGRVELERDARERSVEQSYAKISEGLRNQSLSTGSVTLGIVAGMGVALAAVWIGLGLTYLFILSLAAVVALPMLQFGSESVASTGRFFIGVLALTLSFSTLVRGAALLLGASHPVTAIARNVINEAVRMKISLVFIVILIVGLAALPGMLQDNVPLRYKVQNFLQYGMGGSFLLAAVLVLFLSVATITFEQRDKVIWQTMTKPVRAWQYLLGKWLGVSVVAALLLGVSATGVYLFTEFLRHQRAFGEIAPFVADPNDNVDFTEDRFVLEYQVLAARETVNAFIPDEDADAIGREVNAIFLREQKAREADPKLPEPDPVKIIKQVQTERLRDFLSVRADQVEGKEYRFEGLQTAKQLNLPMALRYKINAGDNAPTMTYRVTFIIGSSPPRVVTTNLAQAMTMPLLAREIDDNGVLRIQVYNGDVINRRANPETMSFAVGDGLQISYPVTTFAPNFLRATLVLWFKLVFLSAIAVTAATFLSFSVASLVSFGVFVIAESSGFLAKAVDTFATTDQNQETIWFNVIVAKISEGVVAVFQAYSRIDPIASVVEGKYISWASAGEAAVLLLAISAVLWAIAATIFRQRELAIYSGQ
ncbi:MAG: hypothetical protein K2X32_11215 [Phycisphaerales bacterium]|nr:hypothetical protein [Phycisphaerales bacterium]